MNGSSSVSKALARIAEKLRDRVMPMRFAPTATYVYCPTDYAWKSHTAYLMRYARPGVEVLLLGMNPGPWGMAQTGIPFGEVGAVRDWLKIDEPIGRPAREHPKRPVLGLACKRNEVSGERLWGWARDAWKTPERFFSRFFVFNYCPLCFMDEGGRNITPDKLPTAQRRPLLEACDAAMLETVKTIRPIWIVGVGNFATDRAKAVFAHGEMKIGTILHPSPASPLANRDWVGQITRQFRDLGIAPSPTDRPAASRSARRARSAVC